MGGGWIWLLAANSFPLFWLVALLAGILALKEYYTIIFQRQGDRPILTGIVLGAIPMLAAYFRRPDLVMAALIFAFLVVFAFIIFRYRWLEDAFELMARLGFGIVYIGLCTAHLILIMGSEQGWRWLLLLTSITIASDTGAYYTGKRLGKTKLCPAVSPGKTLEGFGGGLLAAILAALLMAAFILPAANSPKVALVAAILSIIGVLGDLTESVLKRSEGIKDSGSLLPGHGGILDRADSLLLTAPVLFYCIHFNLLTP